MGSVVPENWRAEYARSAVEQFDRLGGGNGGNSMWQQSVENRLSQIHQDIRDLRSDFRWTWGGMVIGGIGFLGVLAKGFGWL